MGIRSCCLVLCSLLLVSFSASEDCSIRVRREWRSLTSQEQQQFYDALYQLKETGFYNQMILKHFYYQRYSHDSSGLLVWHRLFMLEMETAIRDLGSNYSCFGMPYWDWTADTLDGFNTPIFSDDQGFGIIREGCITSGPFAGFMRANEIGCVARQLPHSNAFFSSFASIQYLIQAHPTYIEFSNNLLGSPHGSVHGSISGDMATNQYSPGDPMLYLHHTFVDKIWAMWEDCWDVEKLTEETLTPEAYNQSDYRVFPDNAPVDMPIPGYSLTPRQTFLMARFNYTYENWEWEKQQMQTFLHPSLCKWDQFDWKKDSNTPDLPVNGSASSSSSLHALKQRSLQPVLESSPSPYQLTDGQEAMLTAARQAFQSAIAGGSDATSAIRAAVVAECKLSFMPDLPQWYIKRNGMEEFCNRGDYCLSPCTRYATGKAL